MVFLNEWVIEGGSEIGAAVVCLEGLEEKFF